MAPNFMKLQNIEHSCGLSFVIAMGVVSWGLYHGAYKLGHRSGQTFMGRNVFSRSIYSHATDGPAARVAVEEPLLSLQPLHVFQTSMP